MTNTAYVFDVDGTLTPSRGLMDTEFKDFFMNAVISNHKVYLVTGSDYPKTVEQVGKDVCESVEFCYNCSGNSIWQKGEEIYTSTWLLPREMKKFLIDKLTNSKFPFRSGNHVEERPGLVNFSVIGRNCTLGERKMYTKYDSDENERNNIAIEFNELFVEKGVIAQVAGETGLDIMPVGKDKAQVADYISYPIVFFGDNMQPGGNDYPLKVQLEDKEDTRCIPVKDWKETYKLLKKMVYN